MTRGKGLISLATRTETERKEIARLGGIASGEARRRKKERRESVIATLEFISELYENAGIKNGEKTTNKQH